MITRWVNGLDDPLNLFEDEYAISLRRGLGALQLRVQLTLHRPENAWLETWMRPGEASLEHFQGALAQAPESGALWLVQCLPDGHGEQHVLDCLERLLNQRDAWRAMIARQARPALPIPLSSLRALAP